MPWIYSRRFIKRKASCFLMQWFPHSSWLNLDKRMEAYNRSWETWCTNYGWSGRSILEIISLDLLVFKVRLKRKLHINSLSLTLSLSQLCIDLLPVWFQTSNLYSHRISDCVNIVQNRTNTSIYLLYSLKQFSLKLWRHFKFSSVKITF